MAISGAVSGNGFDIASAHGGDWLAYTVNIPSAGAYSLDFRVASQGSGGNGGRGHVLGRARGTEDSEQTAAEAEKKREREF